MTTPPPRPQRPRLLPPQPPALPHPAEAVAHPGPAASPSAAPPLPAQRGVAPTPTAPTPFTGAAPTVVHAVGGDFVPLSRRVGALMTLRLVATGVTVVIARLADVVPARELWPAAVYLAVTAVLSLLVLLPGKRLGLAGLGTALSLDCVAAQAAHQYVGANLGTDFVLAAFLAMVCLLASFRTGIRMALWQTVLGVFAWQGVKAGLLPESPGHAVADPELALGAWLTLMWLTVLAVSASASVGERELRRRRYDSEALRTFATGLHEDEAPEQVMDRALQFVVGEMDGGRALFARVGTGGEAELLRRVDGVDDPGAGGSSRLLQGPRDRTRLTLRFDPREEPWLDRALPGARRVVLVPVDAGEDDRLWLVFEHAGQRGTRVEQRLVAMCAQLGATTSLALSRAALLQRVRAAATMDGLTGVANRRSFDELLAQVWARYRAEGTPCGLVVVDADHFKAVNDTHGHQVGDQVLQGVARALVTACAGSGAVVHRYGGEEFTVVVPGAGAEATAVLAERMRVAMHHYDGPVPITASFGVAELTPALPDGPALVAAADAALYRAKESGRDRVVVSAGVGTPASP